MPVLPDEKRRDGEKSQQLYQKSRREIDAG
jgi:hypothetical protein